MTKETAAKQRGKAEPVASERPSAPRSRIHPVVIYPFKSPADYSDLEELYRLVASFDGDRESYARPITVIDRKTHLAAESNKSYLAFRKEILARHSDIIDAWCVDTCQMWYAGLGHAWEGGAAQDTYWLVPGDFNYGSGSGQEVLSRLHQLPEIVRDLRQDLCIGEIATDHNNSKQLIDTYGTFALLYNWFPTEAEGIRNITERPRSEFFAIGHAFLGEMLRQRWYAYEQTMVMLLKAVFGQKQISKYFVGGISDLPQGRESLASALQQVQRTERVLKSLWLEWNQSRRDWMEEYFRLEERSDEVRRTAMLILRNLLRNGVTPR
ncbi:MAG: hypothetical protein U1G07_16605 [Verrucomicrobiota bacterium]